MTDLGKMKHFLGVEVKQENTGIFIHQQKYAEETLIRFSMDKCNNVGNHIIPWCRLTSNMNGKLVDAIKYKKKTGKPDVHACI